MEEDKPRDRHHRRRDSPTPMKKAQVFYYISRNGRLEQPHFLEITLFPNHPLRLKDVLNRLAVLRGNAMPFLYSWSCKRNYKSGYVWNDLSENDVVYPAEGSEYVLKASQLVDLHASQLVDLHASSEKLQQIHITNNRRQPVQVPNLPTKTRKQQLAPSPLKELTDQPDSDLEYDEDEDYEYDDGDKHIYPTTAPSTTPHSRGVSTGPTRPPTQTPTESTRFDSARCSTSKRFALNNDDEIGIESAPSRNSVLMQFIACGGSVGSKGKTVRRTEKGIGKGVVCKMAGNMMGEEEMIKYMSENPRFGKLQTEDKEYFSGSIVESIREDQHVVPPMLKKSNSYNEEKSKREEMEGKNDEDEENENDGIKGRCLPLMILTSTSSKQPKKP